MIEGAVTMDATLVIAYFLVAILVIAGLIGSVIPFLPGPPLIFLGALVYALATDFHPISAGRLLFLAGLAALVRVQRRFRDRPSFTRLVATDQDLLRLLQIVGLMSGFRVFASLDAALHSYRAAGLAQAAVGNE